MFKTISVSIAAWNAMMSAYSLHGNWDSTLRHFNSLRQYNLTPDAVTLSLLLSAASHAGNIDGALDLYHSMQSKYGIVPDIKHSTIIVDALSRAGQLREAVDFIAKYIPNPGIF